MEIVIKWGFLELREWILFVYESIRKGEKRYYVLFVFRIRVGYG